MKKLNYACLALGLALSLGVQALSVSPMLVYFHSGNNVKDLNITNADSTVEYAQVIPAYLANPESNNAPIVVFEPGTNPQSFGLMVTPTKLAIQAGTSRKVRIVNLMTHLTQDRVYTLTINNINSPQKIMSSAKGSSAEMSMSYGYKVIVFVLPANPLPVITAQRNGPDVTIRNTGNSYISLRSGQLCDPSGDNCKDLPAALNYNVLYAGNTWKFTLPHPGIVKFTGVYAETQSMKVQSN